MVAWTSPLNRRRPGPAVASVSQEREESTAQTRQRVRAMLPSRPPPPASWARAPAPASALATLSCGTDNLGNTFLLDRCLTTKYPLGVVLMEVAFQCRRRGLALRANFRLRGPSAVDARVGG